MLDILTTVLPHLYASFIEFHTIQKSHIHCNYIILPSLHFVFSSLEESQLNIVLVGSAFPATLNPH
jgi:hypothetical protein